MKLYIVRHGETEWNTFKILQGFQDSTLTEKGKDQARMLRDSLEETEFHSIYSSPLGRAHNTAKILTEGRNQPIELVPEFMEMGFGKVEGTPREKFKEKYPEEHYNLWNQADQYNPEAFNGESFSSLRDRVEKGVYKLLEDYEKNGGGDKNILLVGHGLVVKMLYNICTGGNLKHFWEEPVPKNTSLSIFEVKKIDDKHEFDIITYSNIEHLEN